MGNKVRVVHANRVRPLLTEMQHSRTTPGTWSPPLIHHGDSDITRSEDEALEIDSDPEEPTESNIIDAPAPGPPPDHQPHTPVVVTRSGRHVKPVQY